MTEDARTRLRAWLHRLLAELSTPAHTVTATELARAARLAPTTLTRFLNADEAAMLSARTVAKLEDAADHMRSRRAGGSFSDAQAPIAANTDDRMSRVIGLLTPTHGYHRALNTDLLAGVGLLRGDLVFIDLSRPPQPGDIACAQQTDRVNATTIFRIFTPPFLTVAPLDPSTPAIERQPLLIDNERVSVLGRVVASLRLS